MRLLDSNIVIYATQPANGWLRTEVLSQPFAVSQVTRVEVLGWHKMTPQDKVDLETFLDAGIPEKRLCYVARGVDPERYSPGVPPEKFTLCFVGALFFQVRKR